ncbi:MAG: hypothetical protein PHN53_07485, partial [Eubacteriales bacterium]|nr:hypothetical protein [Eubacteriales bacterium]
ARFLLLAQLTGFLAHVHLPSPRFPDLVNPVCPLYHARRTSFVLNAPALFAEVDVSAAGKTGKARCKGCVARQLFVK